MGFEKLQKRSSKKIIVVDSDDEDRTTASDCKNEVCRETSCDSRPVRTWSPVVDLDEPGTPAAEAEPTKPQAAPDFLGTPVSSRLRRTNSVRFLKLRPSHPSHPSPKSGVADRKAVPSPKAKAKAKSFVQTLQHSRAIHLASSETASKPCRLSSMSRSVSRAPVLSPLRKSKHFKPRGEASILDCDELLRNAGNRSQGTRPPVALVIKKRWCDKIFEGSKIWEIRGTPLTKRGRICIAQSKSKTLVGEVEVVDCLKVGRKVDGRLVPWSTRAEDMRNFIGAPENLQKHCVEDLNWVPYSKVFAWVLDNKLRYEQPEPYRHKPGCIQWVKLEPGENAKRSNKSKGSKGRAALLQCPTPPRAVPQPAPQPAPCHVALRPATSTEPGWALKTGGVHRVLHVDDLQPTLGQVGFLDDDPDVIKTTFLDDDPDGASSDPIEDVD